MVSLVAYLHHVFVERSTTTNEADEEESQLDRQEALPLLTETREIGESCANVDALARTTTACDKSTQTSDPGGLAFLRLCYCSFYCVFPFSGFFWSTNSILC